MSKTPLLGYLAFALLALAAPAGCARTAEPALFNLSSLELEPLAPHTGELFTLSFTLTNSGGSRGDYEAVLYLTRMISLFEEDKSSEKSFNLTVAVPAGQTRTVAFEKLSAAAEGLYKARIGDQLKYFEVGC